MLTHRNLLLNGYYIGDCQRIHRVGPNLHSGAVLSLLRLRGRRENLAIDHRVLEARRVLFDDVEAAIGVFVAQRIGPRAVLRARTARTA